jgi:hypothetical protein
MDTTEAQSVFSYSAPAASRHLSGPQSRGSGLRLGAAPAGGCYPARVRSLKRSRSSSATAASSTSTPRPMAAIVSKLSVRERNPTLRRHRRPRRSPSFRCDFKARRIVPHGAFSRRTPSNRSPQCGRLRRRSIRRIPVPVHAGRACRRSAGESETGDRPCCRAYRRCPLPAV